jgi:hypothetical protein
MQEIYLTEIDPYGCEINGAPIALVKSVPGLL